MSGDQTRFMRPADLLRAKVCGDRPRDLELDPSAVERAHTALAARARRYPDTVLAEADSLEAELRASGDDPGGPRAHLGALAGIAHDMRGQGASYGYPLVTKIAASLSDYASAGGDEPEVIAAHIDALRAVAAGRLTGDGGPAGRELVDALRLTTESAPDRA